MPTPPPPLAPEVIDLTGGDDAPPPFEAKPVHCVTCWAAPPSVLARPCGHLVVCGPCAAKSGVVRGGACPMCRQTVKSVIRNVYLP